MFEILVRPHFEELPAAGVAFTCENWACPSKWACAHHFCRSYEYAAMIVHGDRRWQLPPFYSPYVASFQDSCDRFELDRPREWLAGYCEPMNRSARCPGCAMPECPSANRVLPFKVRQK